MSSETVDCRRKADDARQRAAQTSEPFVKSAYEKVAEHWMLLARLDSLIHQQSPLGARLPELDISQGQPSQPQPNHRRTGEDAQDNVQSAGNTPQPPQSIMDGTQFLVLLAGRREQ